MTRLHFTLTIDGLEDETLVVRGFEGQESLSDSHFLDSACFGFRYYIDLASREEKLKPEQIVDCNAELRIYRDGECVQRVHGIVRQFTQGDIGYHYTYYSLILVPALERLSLRHNSRIFQQKTTIDIVSTLLEEMGIEEFAFALRRKCQPREFCVQYRETDLAFLHRLTAEEGWVYSFEHLEGKHTLLFSDNSTVLPTLESPIVHNNLSGGVAGIPYISSFSKQTQAEVAEVKLRDYSFKRPSHHFLHNPFASDLDYQRNNYEYYDYPGRYKDDVNGKAFSQIRLEYLRREAHLATGKSNHPLIRPGYRFELIEHVNQAMNRKWVIVSVTHKGSQPQALQEEGTQGATTYSNHFNVIPSSYSQNWRATPQPKPQVDGPMMAIVTGPPGEEIYCDEYGRVKVRFPWDRYSQDGKENRNENSSCWVRVSQGWAGSQYGMMTIPRIGHEVLVAFLNGDPDQPIIIGRTYHAANMPPYELPKHKTRTVIRTETHQGQGSNEIRFEDQAESEEIYIHAQKDQNIVVENNESTTVMENRTESVGKDESISIGNDKTVDVTRDHHEQIGRDKHKKVAGNQITDIKKDDIHNIGNILRDNVYADHQYVIGGHFKGEIAGTQTMNVGDKISHNTRYHELMAFEKFVIKGPGGKITLDASGITLEGAVINLKGNVSMGGSGSSQVPVLKSAANSAKPIAKECPTPNLDNEE